MRSIMPVRSRLQLSCIFALGVLTPAIAFAQQPASPTPRQSSPLPTFDVPLSGVRFQTGDTWTQNGQTFRLYGVQSCLRSTTFTNAVGAKLDCGEASIAYLAALFRDSKPRCSAIAQSKSPPVVFTVCAAHIGKNILDLGTILVTQGFSFAAVDANGKSLNFQYAVFESEAQKNKRGLWAAADLPHPNKILANAYRASASRSPQR
jgi:endonuclease YncB( thermonuclease family)